ncbi:MAG: dynamin family protein [Betaproteobacteria bacterium]|nr:dynamin family protein [Betaproteobacteria bacterium]
MAETRHFTSQFEAYGAWRGELIGGVVGLRDWLQQQELSDAQTDQRLGQLIDKLHEDKLVIAFVAEFSRGKSELINAIFFADFGQRLLPSSAGRTTMCPTELLYDSAQPPSIRLLPIETRAKDAPVQEYKAYRDEWMTIPLDLSSSDRMGEALSHVSETKRVPVETAREYALYHDDDALNEVTVHEDGTVDIPAWRHAVINFPHPLLREGLVILDTPGLNAIGTEPELTLNLLPNAHGVLFILAADTGVTKTDIETWRGYIDPDGGGDSRGRLVVLNKIDGLWDELKTNAEIEAEINRQTDHTAQLLDLPRDQIFPVSAQKALVAKVNGDENLLAKSRLPLLEAALASELVPVKHEIVGSGVKQELALITHKVQTILRSRDANVQEQLAELVGLRGKNQEVIAQMMRRVAREKESFEKGLQRFVALRSIFSQHTYTLFNYLGREALRTEESRTRRAIEGAAFTRDIRAAMSSYFRNLRQNVEHASEQIAEIHDMMVAMYDKFNREHGLDKFAPPTLPTLKYQKELQRLERAYNLHVNTLWNIATKSALQRKFFETVASRAKQIFDQANRDAEMWLKTIMGPLESQVRESQVQHRRRLESIKRIHNASDELEERIAELEQVEQSIREQMQGLTQYVANTMRVTDRAPQLDEAAA